MIKNKKNILNIIKFIEEENFLKNFNLEISYSTAKTKYESLTENLKKGEKIKFPENISWIEIKKGKYSFLIDFDIEEENTINILLTESAEDTFTLESISHLNTLFIILDSYHWNDEKIFQSIE